MQLSIDIIDFIQICLNIKEIELKANHESI